MNAYFQEKQREKFEPKKSNNSTNVEREKGEVVREEIVPMPESRQCTWWRM